MENRIAAVFADEQDAYWQQVTEEALSPEGPDFEPRATADYETEKTSCCNANATYDEWGALYCKACFEEVEWVDASDPDAAYEEAQVRAREAL